MPVSCRAALARLPELDLGELCQQWRALYKANASPHLSRELLLHAVAYRMQEMTLGGGEWSLDRLRAPASASALSPSRA
jgi:hypothetical protein